MNTKRLSVEALFSMSVDVAGYFKELQQMRRGAEASILSAASEMKAAGVAGGLGELLREASQAMQGIVESGGLASESLREAATAAGALALALRGVTQPLGGMAVLHGSTNDLGQVLGALHAEIAQLRSDLTGPGAIAKSIIFNVVGTGIIRYFGGLFKKYIPFLLSKGVAGGTAAAAAAAGAISGLGWPLAALLLYYTESPETLEKHAEALSGSVLGVNSPEVEHLSKPIDWEAARGIFKDILESVGNALSGSVLGVNSPEVEHQSEPVDWQGAFDTVKDFSKSLRDTLIDIFSVPNPSSVVPDGVLGIGNPRDSQSGAGEGFEKSASLVDCKSLNASLKDVGAFLVNQPLFGGGAPSSSLAISPYMGSAGGVDNSRVANLHGDIIINAPSGDAQSIANTLRGALDVQRLVSTFSTGRFS